MNLQRHKPVFRELRNIGARIEIRRVSDVGDFPQSKGALSYQVKVIKKLLSVRYPVIYAVLILPSPALGRGGGDPISPTVFLAARYSLSDRGLIFCIAYFSTFISVIRSCFQP